MWTICNAVADLNRKIMPASIPLVLINAIQEAGVDVSALRKKYNLEDKRLIDANELVSPIEIQLFILEALKDCESIPVSFRFGKQLSVNLMGDLGQVMMTASTLDEALHDLKQYVKAFNYLIGYDISEYKDDFIMVPQLGVYSCGPEYNLRFSMEAALTSLLCIIRFLTGETIYPKAVSFTYQQPGYHQEYDALFGKNVQFGAAENKVVFDTKDLTKKIVTGNSAVHELFKKRCEERLKQIDNRQTIESLALNYLKSEPTIPSFEQLAFKMGFTPSSLRRRLSTGNTSYQTLVDQVRKEQAEKLLKNRNTSVEYIALQLGFADASNFRRAFKRWTGETPSDYRKHFA